MRGAECNLLRLRKVLIDVPDSMVNATPVLYTRKTFSIPVQDQFANILDGDQVLRPELGSVKDVELKAILILLRNGLNAEFPLWILPALDSVIQILSMEIRILAPKLQGLVPDK